MNRDRLTITLKKDFIKKIDEMVDGLNIRNRSHAIEYLLSQIISPQISQAVILAGGRGVKMQPLTLETPKSLFPIKGKPILEHSLRLLRENGIKDITIVVGFKGERIREYFGDGSRFSVRITYVDEGPPAGTGGALALAKHLITNGSFIVLYADVLIDINLDSFIKFHQEQGKIGTIALTTSPEASAYGQVLLNGPEITEFVEKPKKTQQTSQLINAGLFIFKPEILDYFPKKRHFRLEDLFPKLAKAGKLAGYTFDGKWFDIGTPKTYEKAIKEW